MKKLKYVTFFGIILVMVIVLSLSYKQFVFKHAVQNTTTRKVSEFKYYDGYQFENKTFFLSEFKLDQDDCIGFYDYSVKMGIFYQFSSPHQLDVRCTTGSRDANLIDVNHDLIIEEENGNPKFPNEMTMTVFGLNDSSYHEVLIHYVWGESKVIPITNDPLFFYYETIIIPSGYEGYLQEGTYYQVEKIKG
jgi:hypothetical protein